MRCTHPNPSPKSDVIVNCIYHRIDICTIAAFMFYKHCIYKPSICNRKPSCPPLWTPFFRADGTKDTSHSISYHVWYFSRQTVDTGPYWWWRLDVLGLKRWLPWNLLTSCRLRKSCALKRNFSQLNLESIQIVDAKVSNSWMSLEGCVLKGSETWVNCNHPIEADSNQYQDLRWWFECCFKVCLVFESWRLVVFKTSTVFGMRLDVWWCLCKCWHCGLISSFLLSRMFPSWMCLFSLSVFWAFEGGTGT